MLVFVIDITSDALPRRTALGSCGSSGLQNGAIGAFYMLNRDLGFGMDVDQA
jgi:hypothetical protein